LANLRYARNVMRSMMLVCLLSLAAGCGGKTKGGGAGPDNPDPDSVGTDGPTGDKVAADSALTGPECAEMIDHIVDVAHEEKKKNLKPDEVPTPNQIAEIKKNERARMTEPCLTLPRSMYRCAIAAATSAELAACQPSQ
jgi:hypothetical protein